MRAHLAAIAGLLTACTSSHGKAPPVDNACGITLAVGPRRASARVTKREAGLALNPLRLRAEPAPCARVARTRAVAARGRPRVGR